MGKRNQQNRSNIAGPVVSQAQPTPHPESTSSQDSQEAPKTASHSATVIPSLLPLSSVPVVGAESELVVREDERDEQIKGLLQQHEAQIIALPDFNAPTSREEAISLLQRVGVQVPESPPSTSIVPDVATTAQIDPSTEAARSAEQLIQDAPQSHTQAPEVLENRGIAASPAITQPDVQAMMAVGDGTIELSREGNELVWADGSDGKLGFVIESSFNRHDWQDEVSLPAGMTRFAPKEPKLSHTVFYRVSYLSGDLRSMRSSDSVVIHFR